MIKLLKFSICLVSLHHLFKIIFNRNPKNVIFYLILVAIFIIEVLTYYLIVLTWNPINCYNEKECTRILLVADPQLIGLQNEPLHALTPLTIWDNDRYLSKTFYHAFNFVQPDVIIFLGDLLDEGSISTDDEFKSYVKRLNNIFLSRPYGIMHVWIPGDNDIGGENDDVITKHKIERFENAFAQPDIIDIKNIKIFKINNLISTIPKLSLHHEFSNLDKIIVGVSHLPLLLVPTLFVDKVLDKLHPHILFTAHTHKSAIISTYSDIRKDRLVIPVTPDNNKIYDYFLGLSEIYEIMVPTCSYRMGTTKIGYGFAVIDSGNLRYTVLWSPSRFLQLILYGIMVVFIIIYTIFSCYCRRVKINAIQYTLTK